MEIRPIRPARKFAVGIRDITLSHVANVELETDEQVTFVNEEGQEYDIVRKNWGYYATPSLGGRLKKNGLRAGLTRNIQSGALFVVLVDEDFEEEWAVYCENEGQELVAWLDSPEFLNHFNSKKVGEPDQPAS